MEKVGIFNIGCSYIARVYNRKFVLFADIPFFMVLIFYGIKTWCHYPYEDLKRAYDLLLPIFFSCTWSIYCMILFCQGIEGDDSNGKD